MAPHESTLRALYAAFNTRDVETVLAALAEDVDWPNGMDGTRVHGKAAVRAYWLNQWTVIDPSVEPGAMVEREDGATSVEVHQVVRDMNGTRLNERVLTHAYWFENGLVTRMEIEA
ncbi:MAG: nuclear transport factor 2 family protein [Dehalococcoidia bacterium]